jgi:K+-sensing histidine kinase KdpD
VFQLLNIISTSDNYNCELFYTDIDPDRFKFNLIDQDKNSKTLKTLVDFSKLISQNIIDNATRYAKTLIKITLKDNYLEFFNDGEPIDEKFVTQGFKAYEKGSHGKFGLGMSIACKTLEFFNYTLVVKNVKDGVSFTITPLSQLEKNVDKGL